MTHPKSQSIFSLCKADPKFPFSSDLLSVWRRGIFTDSAVAFLTAGGVDFFANNCLNRQDCKRCRLCFTVQWPTDLDAVVQLSRLLGPNLRIFLGAKTPVETGTDVTPLLHSKVVYTDHGDGTCTAFVGSHNWTSNALNGVNCEASIRVECESTNAFAVDLRQHLDQCAQLCVPFDPIDLTYYKVLQRQLSTARPPAPDAEDVTAFQEIPGAPAVVIHAEGEEERYRFEEVMLFLPIRERNMANWFDQRKPTTVLLFMYPKGTLLGQDPPLSRPILFSGPVGTNNVVSISPSREQDVTCEIRDLSWPQVQEVTSRNIPPVKDEMNQVIAKLRRDGPADIPVYHRGKQPVLEVGVRFEEHPDEVANVATDQAGLSNDVVGWYDADSIQNGVLIFKQPIPERVINLDVPEQWLYAQDVDTVVQRCLSRKLEKENVRIALKRQKGTHAYVYRASFVLRF